CLQWRALRRQHRRAARPRREPLMAGTLTSTVTAAIAFDLDGTLVDSAAGVGHALNTSLSRAGLATFDPATIRGWIGDGPDTLIQRALAASPVRDTERTTLAARL